MAYFVVAIHTTNWSLMGLVETAVPYFFLASGFFLFRKLGDSREKDLKIIRNWIGSVLKLYLIWTAIYLPFTIIGFVQDGMVWYKAAVVFLRNLTLVGLNFLSWPLWYLLALVWGGVLIYIMRWMRIPVWGMFFVGVVLYLIAQLLHLEYQAFYLRLFMTTRNGVFLGLMYITAGGLISRCLSRLCVKGFVFLVAIVGVGCFVGFQFFPYFLPLLAISIFLLTLYWNFAAPSETIARQIGSTSKTIYLTHMLFAGSFRLIFGIERGWVPFLIAAGCSTILSCGLHYIKNRDLSWIR